MFVDVELGTWSYIARDTQGPSHGHYLAHAFCDARFIACCKSNISEGTDRDEGDFARGVHDLFDDEIDGVPCYRLVLRTYAHML